MTHGSHARFLTAVLFDVLSVSAVEAAVFLALIVVALVVIGALFAVFLHLDERAP